MFSKPLEQSVRVLRPNRSANRLLQFKPEKSRRDTEGAEKKSDEDKTSVPSATLWWIKRGFVAKTRKLSKTAKN
jgi:hypothetical protein